MSQHCHGIREDHPLSLIRSPLGSSAAVCNLGSLSFFALASPSSCSLAKTLDSDFNAIDSFFTKDIMAGIGSSSAASSSRDAMPSAGEPAPVAGRNPTPAEEEPLTSFGQFRPRRTPNDAMSDGSFDELPEEISQLSISRQKNYQTDVEMHSAPGGDASETTMAAASDGTILPTITQVIPPTAPQNVSDQILKSNAEWLAALMQFLDNGSTLMDDEALRMLAKNTMNEADWPSLSSRACVTIEKLKQFFHGTIWTCFRLN